MLKTLYLGNPSYKIFNKHVNLTTYLIRIVQVSPEITSHLTYHYLCELFEGVIP